MNQPPIYDPALDTPTFLRGWCALHFLGIAPHPDEPHEWDDMIRPLVDEAWRRRETDEITDHQLYCSCAQLQGLRLALDGNLRCHVQVRLGEQAGCGNRYGDVPPQPRAKIS